MDDAVSKIILAFFLGLVIIYCTARLIGADKKAKWFKKRDRVNIFTRRGMLGETWHFGHPRTWQGFAVTVGMYGIIGVAGYLIIFR